MELNNEYDLDDDEGTVEEEHYLNLFKKAVHKKDDVQINLLMREEGILTKWFPCDDQGSFLHVVAERGTIETATEICKLVSNVNVETSYNQTPIYFALGNSIEMVNFLIEKGAKVNVQNMVGETPLHHAVRHSEEIVKILLKNKAKADIMDENGSTPLHEALLSGTEEIVRLIVNKIFSETRKDYCKEVEKTEEIVTTLLKYKGILKISVMDIPLLVLFAAKIGNDDIFKLMLNEIRENFCLIDGTEYVNHVPKELNIGGYYNRTALHYAIREQFPEVVRFLLKFGADVNCKTRESHTPLHYAAALQNEEICKILLLHGADVDSTAPGLGSPLFQVCGNFSITSDLDFRKGYFYRENYDTVLAKKVFNPKITQLLLENGANPDIPREKGETPFLEACASGSLEHLKILLQFGADFEIQNENGDSALHYAALGNNLENVKFLLEIGLDIDILNNENLTPFLLLMQKCRPEHLEMIEYLVNCGVDVNIRDIGQITALHMASIVFESMVFVEGLLELGANWKIQHELTISLVNDLPSFGSGRKFLISFIALNETKLENCINCYFEHNIEELTEAFRYFEQSRLEVEKLKSTKIVQGKRVSYYDFLTGGIYNTVQVAKNEDIRKVFRFTEYFMKFPCYQFFLQMRFERIVALTDTVDKMADILKNCLPRLPTVVICQILNLLNSSDFKNFERNLFQNNAVAEQEPDPTLKFNCCAYDSKIIEIRDTGVVVSLLDYPNLQPAFLPYSQMKTYSNSNPKALDFNVGGEIEVLYLGMYPESGKTRLRRLR